MKALITGASGFLGSHIVDASLAHGDEVRALVRATSDLSYLRSLRGIEYVHGDVTDAVSIDTATRGVDVVYHSAARVADYGSRRAFWEANVAGTERLLAAAARNGVRRFVFVSSPSVVGDGRDQIDIDERHPYPSRYLNFYSETKALAEQRVLRANSSRMTTCALRPRGVWGPRDKTGWLPKIIDAMARGRMLDLSFGRDVYATLCHAENAARACMLASRSEAVGGNAYFITDGEATNVWRFARVLADRFGVAPPRRKLPASIVWAIVEVVEALWRLPMLGHRRAPPVSRYAVSLLSRSATYDIGAARRDFGYSPRIAPATGMDQLMAWVGSIGGVDAFIGHVRHG
jgi:2-alkyl-3-oxoalkanoate reductase